MKKFLRNMIFGREIRLSGRVVIHQQLNVPLLAIHYQWHCEHSLIDGTGTMKPIPVPGPLAPTLQRLMSE